MLFTLLLSVSVASAQSCCQKAASCEKTSKVATAKETTSASTANASLFSLVNLTSTTAATTPANCSPQPKCTEAEKKACAGVCPPGCSPAGKSMKTAEVKPTEKEGKSTKM